MDITLVELTASITALLLWVTIVDLAILANVSCWFCIVWMKHLRPGKEESE